MVRRDPRSQPTRLDEASRRSSKAPARDQIEGPELRTGPAALVALQRTAGNAAVGHLLASRRVQRRAVEGEGSGRVVQREVVHWHLTNGRRINKKDGHSLIGRLAERDKEALKLLPDRDGRSALGSFEFGLGRDKNNRYCIVEGAGTNVNWSEAGTTKGMTPVAHSHPVEGRQLTRRYALDDIMSAAKGENLSQTRQSVLPSIDDVMVAYRLRSSQPTHHVYTPYRVVKKRGRWHVRRGAAGKGRPLTFRIANIVAYVTTSNDVQKILLAELTAMAGDEDVMTVETWSSTRGKTNRAVNFTRPDGVEIL